MNKMHVSRRKFAQLLGIGTAVVVIRPALSFAKPTQSVATPLAESGNIVRLSANENPYGPSPKAFQAIQSHSASRAVIRTNTTIC